MASDMLSGGTPKRLVRREGEWTLEVVRQIAVDRSVYRPQSQTIQGRDFILSFLQRSPQYRGLASAAGQLLRAHEGDSKASFDAVGGEWVPSVIAPSYIDQLKRQRRGNTLENQRLQLLSVQAECLWLRHAHAHLVKRVEELERRIEGGAQILPAGAAPAGAAAAPIAGSSAASEGAAAAGPGGQAVSASGNAAAVTGSAGAAGSGVTAEAPAPAAGEPAAAAIGSAAAAAAESPAAAGVEAAGAAVAEAPAPAGGADARMKLPPSADFIRCIEQLIGGDVTAKEVTEAVDLSDSGQGFWLSTIVDENDEEIGAVVMNTQATVSLGGTLLMIPEDELKTQVETNDPSEDSLAASSEVCNALTGSINSVDGNPEMRSNFMEQLDLEKHAWLTTPSLSIKLHDSFDGKTLVIAR